MKKLLLALLLFPIWHQVEAQRPSLTSPVLRFSDANGIPLAFGTLQSYQAGTTTPLATYVDATSGTLNTNPIVLDATGSTTVFLGANVYKFVLKDATGVVQWTADNIAEGMFQSAYVNSVFGRTGVVTAQTGDYSCAQVTGCISSIPTLYNQTVQVAGTAAPQRPILNFIAGVSGSVNAPTVTVAGSGYTGAPSVAFSGGSCVTQPTGSTTVLAGAVTGLVLVTNGAGCTSAPTVAFSGGGGSGATATVALVPNGIACVDDPVKTSTDCTMTFGTGGSASLAPLVQNDVTALRGFNTTYQNTTSGPMYISGFGTITGGSGDSQIACLDGPTGATLTVWAHTDSFTVPGEPAGFACFVPAGFYYMLTTQNHVGASPGKWFEYTGFGGGGSGGGVQVAQDIGGTAALPKVVGIQTVPVATTAPTSGQALVYNGTSYAPTSLGVPTLSNLGYTPAQSTIAAAVAACTGAACAVDVPPSYAGVDVIPSIPASTIVVYDSRSGVLNRQYNNWVNTFNPTVGQDSAAAEKAFCNDLTATGFTTITPGNAAYFQRYCRSVTINSFSPGYTLGPSAIGPAGWQLGAALNVNAAFHGNGIRSSFNVNLYCLGQGDCNNNYLLKEIAGRKSPADEGVNPFRVVLTEVPYMYTGTVATDGTRPGGIGVTSTLISCTICTIDANVALQATGLYLAEATPIATSYIQSLVMSSNPLVSSTATIAAIPASMVSTAWGTLTSSCLVNQTAANTGSSCTFTVSVASGTFNANYLVATIGAAHNQSFIGSVSTAGAVATITMNAQASIPTGAEIYQGQAKGSATKSCTGTGLDLVANDVMANGSPIKYLFDVVGCKSTTTAQIGSFDTTGFTMSDLGNVSLFSTALSNPLSSVSDVLTVNTNYFNDQIIGGQTINIAGSAYAAFNGSCTNAQIAGNRNSLTCTHTGAGTHTDAVTTGVAVTLGTTGYGNSQIAFYDIAETLDVRSPVTGLPDGSMILEPNQMTLTAGTSVFQAHYPLSQKTVQNTYYTNYNPYDGGLSRIRYTTGYGMFGQGPALQNPTGFEGIINTTPLSAYAGFGGTNLAKPYLYLQGLFASYLEADPPQNAGPVDYIRCPLTPAGCADASYYYAPHWWRGNGTDFRDNWNPSTSTYCITMYMGGAKGWCLSPTGGLSFQGNVNLNSNKLTNVANGTVATDAAAFGQVVTLGGTLSGSNITFGAGAGGTPTSASIVGLDVTHVVSFTTGGTAPTANATLFTVTFTVTRGHTPACIVQPVNFALYAAFAQVPFLISYGPTGYTVNSNTTALPNSTAFVFNVTCP